MNRSTEHWFEFYATASDEERGLYEKVESFGKYFRDMLFSEDDDEMAMGIPEELEYMDYTWFRYIVEPMEGKDGYYNPTEQILAISSAIEDNTAIILHEMIHLHEDMVNELPLFYHDILYWRLYTKLREKIDNLEELIHDNTFLYENQDRFRDGGLHDIVFLLKSFDLDLIMGYKLGTVYGYGKQDDINN